ncbi:MAG TPA: glycosyltransferase family 2 protein [Bryobacteraceae bacterium]|nr:glycosyltransferase family 2 protein [Bryobacteraceae bacterium]
MFWYWCFVGPALLLAILSLRGERKRAAYVERRLAETPGDLPPASIIVPVKGDDYHLRDNLAALASQDYPDFELIVVAHAAADIPPGVLPSGVRVVLAPGGEASTSEKVHNLRTAVIAARKRSHVYAFADSDGRVTKRWLRSLVAPLSAKGVGASTGYRWYAPVPPTFWTLMRSVWDAVALSQLGPGDCGFAWGGAMAMRREVFHELDVRGHWQDTVSDDYTLTAVVHAAKLTIAFAPGAMVPCFERLPAGRILSWMRRQLTITRVYNGRLWWLGLAAHIFYCGGMAASTVASLRGFRLAEWALIAQLSPGMLKGLNRATLAKAALPECEAWFKRHLWVHAVWVPLATWLWLSVLVASAFGNTIRWRGNTYHLRKPHRQSSVTQ